MKNQVKEILNREIALQNELKAVVVEKEQLAINVLADAEVLVRELGCAHLLSTNTDSIVNVAINKGRPRGIYSVSTATLLPGVRGIPIAPIGPSPTISRKKIYLGFIFIYF
jgi:hypothetical protein